MHISEAIQPVSKLLTAYHIAQGHTDTPFPKDGCTQGACPQYVALIASWAAADSTTDADPPPVGIGYQSVHPGAADLSLDGAGGETVKPSALYPGQDEDPLWRAWYMVWSIAQETEGHGKYGTPKYDMTLDHCHENAMAACQIITEVRDAAAGSAGGEPDDRMRLWKDGGAYHLDARFKHRERRLAVILATIWQEYEGEDFKFAEAVRDLTTALAQLSVDNANQYAKAPTSQERAE